MFEDIGVLDSCRFVAERAEDVTIQLKEIAQLAESSRDGDFAPPPWNRELHFSDGTEKTLYYLLVLDALNFCFWGDQGKPRWQVTYKGKTYDGYWALAISLKKAFQNCTYPLWDADWLRTIEKNSLSRILQGNSPVEIPLLSERLANLREIGEVLWRDYGGRFTNLVDAAGHNAIALVRAIANSFKSFADEAEYKGQKVYFYKRAQIFVSDLASTFNHEGWGKFHNLDKLTAFADYKIPQVLRGLGILEYSGRLARIVDGRELIQAGSPQEVEIRACTIWTIELLRKKLFELGKSYNAVELDWLIWQWGQNLDKNTPPYHLTRTIYY